MYVQLGPYQVATKPFGEYLGTSYRFSQTKKSLRVWGLTKGIVRRTLFNNRVALSSSSPE